MPPWRTPRRSRAWTATAAADAVDALIEAELLHPGLPPRFVHPIIQQALQDSIPPAERAQLHLAAARELARDPARCERVAAHLLAAGPPAPLVSDGRSMR